MLKKKDQLRLMRCAAYRKLQHHYISARAYARHGQCLATVRDALRKAEETLAELATLDAQLAVMASYQPPGGETPENKHSEEGEG